MLSSLHRAGFTSRKLLLVFGLLALISIVKPANRADAETLIGLTVQNALISFDSATPGIVTPIGSVTGLTAGDQLIGIDRRPQRLGASNFPGPNNGRIYALGVNNANGSARIYTLSEVNAAATLISTLAADPADVTAPTPFTTVQGTSFGIDFNPTVDRLRVTSNTGQNLRMNVDNGLVNLDVPLAYQAGDVNLGDAPVDVAVAYSNNFGGATTTTLGGVDVGQDPDALVIHANPNGGLLQTSLNLPFNSGADVVAYDVSGLSGTPYFASNTGTSGSSSLYAAGPGGVTLVGIIGGEVALRGLAAPVGLPVPEPSTAILCVLAAFSWTARFRRPA